MRKSASQCDTNKVLNKLHQSGQQTMQIVLAADPADPDCGMVQAARLPEVVLHSEQSAKFCNVCS